MKAFIIVKTGSTFPALRERFGDFEDWMIEAGGAAGIPVIDPSAGEALPAVKSLSGAVITGSPAMVTERTPWMESLSVWIQYMVDARIPLLGVCFGHQLLAQAMGGVVDYHPQGREIGTVEVALTEAGRRDTLLGYLPNAFAAHVTHAQTVIRLPENGLRLAGNAFEPHQAFRIGACAWGVQFHPEFSAEIMRGYLAEYADSLREQGQDVAALLDSVVPTREANRLLQRFYAYCREHPALAG